MIKVLSLLLSVVILQLGCFSGNSVLLDSIFKGFFVDAPETAEANNGEDRIHYIKLTGADGDAILIESNGRFGLVDAGNRYDATRDSEKYKDASGITVRDYLSIVGVEHLDFIIATHSHSDHIGGMPNIADGNLVSCNTVYFYKTYDETIDANNQKEKSYENPKFYKAALEKMEDNHAICFNTINHSSDCIDKVNKLYDKDDDRQYYNLAFENCDTGDLDDDYISFVFGDLNISIYNLYNRTNMRENTNSIVTYIEHKDSKIKTLLMADLDVFEEAEQKIGKAIINEHPGPIDVLKVGHHGHAGSTSKNLIDLLKPNCSIISCNVYDTENPEKIGEFSAFYAYEKLLSKKIYRTCDASSAALIQNLTNGNITGAKNWEPDKGPGDWVEWDYNIEYGTEKKGEYSYYKHWVIINENGSFYLNNWIFSEKYDGWYFMGPDGVMETDRWRLANDGWCYLGENGAMVTGWKSIGGKWYYFDSNGLMQTGWIKDDGKWYYLENSGAMATGWKSVDGKWYYLNSNGSMKTGWLQDNGCWYYMNDSGIMQTGWQKIGDKWYYFYSNGKMASDEVIDGYYVNKDGVWQN